MKKPAEMTFTQADMDKVHKQAKIEFEKVNEELKKLIHKNKLLEYKRIAQKAKDHKVGKLVFEKVREYKRIAQKAVDDFRMTPAEAEAASEFMASLDDRDVIECFGGAADSKKNIKQSPYACFEYFLSKVPEGRALTAQQTE